MLNNVWTLKEAKRKAPRTALDRFNDMLEDGYQFGMSFTRNRAGLYEVAGPREAVDLWGADRWTLKTIMAFVGHGMLKVMTQDEEGRALIVQMMPWADYDDE